MNPMQILGVLLGTAGGDGLGLPYEGLSPQRAWRLWGPPDRQRFWLLGLAGLGVATLWAACFRPATRDFGGDRRRYSPPAGLVLANRRITHTAPRAEYGAFPMALAVRHAGTTQGQVQGQVFYQNLAAHIG